MSDLVNPVAVGFRGAAVRLSQAALADLARVNHYEVAVLEALLDVESSGSGFDARNRPKILPEPHVFYRNLRASPAAQQRAVAAGVAYPRQGERPYPIGSDANYQRLVTMCSIDSAAALQSASWGIAQVMGFNYAVCGYASVFDMVRDAMASEAAQAGFLLKFLSANHLDIDLRCKRWAAVARGYNGSSAVGVYTAKLENAYRHHCAEPPMYAASASAPALRQAPAPVAPAAPAGGSTDALNNSEFLQVSGGG